MNKMTRERDLEVALYRAIQALHTVNATILKSPAVTDTIMVMNSPEALNYTLYDFIANEIHDCRQVLKK